MNFLILNAIILMDNVIANKVEVEERALNVRTFIGAILFTVNVLNVNVILMVLPHCNAIVKMELVFVDLVLEVLFVINVLEGNFN